MSILSIIFCPIISHSSSTALTYILMFSRDFFFYCPNQPKPRKFMKYGENSFYFHKFWVFWLNRTIHFSHSHSVGSYPLLSLWGRGKSGVEFYTVYLGNVPVNVRLWCEASPQTQRYCAPLFCGERGRERRERDRERREDIYLYLHIHLRLYILVYRYVNISICIYLYNQYLY